MEGTHVASNVHLEGVGFPPARTLRPLGSGWTTRNATTARWERRRDGVDNCGVCESRNGDYGEELHDVAIRSMGEPSTTAVFIDIIQDLLLTRSHQFAK